MNPSEDKDYEIFGSEVKEEENVDQWLMSYADMITLLLGFFAVLLSMSTFNTVKMEMFSQYFSGQPKRMTMPQLEAQIQEFAKEENLIGQVEARLTSRGVEINFKDKLMFELGKTDLKEEAIPILTKIAGLLKYQEINERKVLVEGHTDSLPIRSKIYPTNWELSTARAGMVVRFFLSQHLDPRRFQSSGYADTRPKNPETDRLLGQPENRRVVVVITPESYISEQEILRQEWSVNGSTANLNADFSKYQTELPPIPISKGKTVADDEQDNAVPAEEPVAKTKPVKQKKEKQPVSNPAAPAVQENKNLAPAAKQKEKATLPQVAAPAVAVTTITAPAPSAAPVSKKAKPKIAAKKQPAPQPSAGPASTSAEKGAQQVNKEIDTFYSAGLKYLSENNKDMALKEFEKVLAIDPKHTPSIIKVKKLKQELGK